MSEMEKDFITPTQQMISSCIGGLITWTCVTPLDVIKIRLQSQQKELIKNSSADQLTEKYLKELRNRPTYFNGTWDALLKMSRYEGVSSLWSGLSPTIIMAIPQTAMYFTAYDQLSAFLKRKYANYSYTNMWVPLFAGGIARTFAATLISPLEMIRTKMQSTRLSYLEVGSAVKHLVKTEGTLSLWKGLVPTLLRDVPFSSIYWLNYETCKLYFKQPQPSLSISFLSGAISGSIAAVITLPFDVVKTHRQIELGDSTTKSMSRNTLGIMKHIHREQGLKGLFVGIVPRLGRVAPACAIMISSYEKGKSFFRNRNQSKLKENHLKHHKKL